MIGGGGDRPVAIARIERQRLFAEYVLAGADRGDHLIGVKGRRRHQPDRVQAGMRQQFLQSGIGRHAIQRRLRPRAFRFDRACRSDQLRAGDPEREVFGMTAAQPSEADDSDANGLRQRCPSAYWPRCAFALRPDLGMKSPWCRLHGISTPFRCSATPLSDAAVAENPDNRGGCLTTYLEFQMERCMECCSISRLGDGPRRPRGEKTR